MLLATTISPTCDTCDRPTCVSHPLLKALQVGIATATILLLMTGTSGCSRGVKQWVQKKTDQALQTAQTLNALQFELVQQYHTQNISIEVQSNLTEPGQARAITVQFTNTPFNRVSVEERASMAKDVARHAKVHFMLNHPQDKVSVYFVNFQDAAIVKSSQTLGAYTLNASELDNPGSVSAVLSTPKQ